MTAASCAGRLVRGAARLALAGAAVLAPLTARGETSGLSATGFVVSAARDVAAPAEKLWSALTRLPAWWSGEHSFSGNAANFALDLRAGGCWCENWDGGSVLHGTVANVAPGRMLRLYASLGPLQSRATTGVLTFEVQAAGSGSRLAMTYRVAGPADTGLAALAPAVDRVLTEQVDRLAVFAERGKAD